MKQNIIIAVLLVVLSFRFGYDLGKVRGIRLAVDAVIEMLDKTDAVAKVEEL